MAITESQRNRTHERIKRAFGQVLREFRANSGMTQEKLGLETDYHSTYISQLERGKKQPSLGTVLILAKQLGVSPATMIKAVQKKLVRQKRIPLRKKSR